MSDEKSRAYVLVQIDPGKERDFANEIVTKGLIMDSKVERLDFVHGSYDFIILLYGKKHEIDTRILEMRKLPYIRRTVTLIPFDVLNLEDLTHTSEK